LPPDAVTSNPLIYLAYGWGSHKFAENENKLKICKEVSRTMPFGDAGYEPGGPIWHMNHGGPHLRTIFNFLGITDLRFVYSGNDEFGGDRLERSLEAAARHVVEVATPIATMKQKFGDNGGAVVKLAPSIDGESGPMDPHRALEDSRSRRPSLLSKSANEL
jgi:hypothetical protein